MIITVEDSCIKVNVAVYKDLIIEFVTKKVFVTRTQCKNAIKPYSSRAYYLFYACVGNDFVCDGDRACRATCRVPGSTTDANRLCAQARRKLPQLTVGDKSAMYSPRQRLKEALRCAPAHTLSVTVAKSPQATADQHNRELVPSPSHHSPL